MDTRFETIIQEGTSTSEVPHELIQGLGGMRRKMNKDFENMVTNMTEVYLTAYQKALEEVRNPQLANQAAINITAILNAQGTFAMAPTQEAMAALMAVINAGKQQNKGAAENKGEGGQE